MSAFVWMDYPIRLTGSLARIFPTQIAGGTQAPRYQHRQILDSDRQQLENLVGFRISLSSLGLGLGSKAHRNVELSFRPPPFSP
jgi:hypothetical protein